MQSDTYKEILGKRLESKFGFSNIDIAINFMSENKSDFYGYTEIIFEWRQSITKHHKESFFPVTLTFVKDHQWYGISIPAYEFTEKYEHEDKKPIKKSFTILPDGRILHLYDVRFKTLFHDYNVNKLLYVVDKVLSRQFKPLEQSEQTLTTIIKN